MSSVFTAVQGVLTILLMISVGIVLGRRGWFSEESTAVMSRLVLQISIPAMLLSNITTTFTRSDITAMGPALLAPFAAISFLYCLGFVVARILRVPKERRGVFRALFAFSNTVFVGVPVNIALFGDEAVPYVTMYYLVNTTLFWTIGVYFIRRDNVAERVPFFSWKTLRQIFSPTVVFFLVALLFVVCEIRIPAFIMSGLKYMAALTTPLAIVIIGVGINAMGLRGLTMNRELAVVLLARFVLAPGLMFFLLSHAEIPALMRKVFIITAAMPVMTQIALIARAYGADHKSAGSTATITTTLSLFAIPVYMLLFGD
jgi:predicted permease